jgi:hypothetical protein
MNRQGSAWDELLGDIDDENIPTVKLSAQTFLAATRRQPDQSNPAPGIQPNVTTRNQSSQQKPLAGIEINDDDDDEGDDELDDELREMIEMEAEALKSRTPLSLTGSNSSTPKASRSRATTDAQESEETDTIKLAKLSVPKKPTSGAAGEEQGVKKAATIPPQNPDKNDDDFGDLEELEKLSSVAESQRKPLSLASTTSSKSSTAPIWDRKPTTQGTSGKLLTESAVDDLESFLNDDSFESGKNSKTSFGSFLAPNADVVAKSREKSLSLSLPTTPKRNASRSQSSRTVRRQDMPPRQILDFR